MCGVLVSDKPFNSSICCSNWDIWVLFSAWRITHSQQESNEANHTLDNMTSYPWKKSNPIKTESFHPLHCATMFSMIMSWQQPLKDLHVFSGDILLAIWLCPPSAKGPLNDQNIFLKADNPHLSAVFSINDLLSECISTTFCHGKEYMLCPP